MELTVTCHPKPRSSLGQEDEVATEGLQRRKLSPPISFFITNRCLGHGWPLIASFKAKFLSSTDPSPGPINYPKENPLVFVPVYRKGPNYYSVSSNRSRMGEAGLQEPCKPQKRPLRMLGQSSPFPLLSITPPPSHRVERGTGLGGSSAGPPLLLTVWLALKNQPANHFSPDGGKSFTGPKSAPSGVT